jgi:hypothetical protein
MERVFEKIFKILATVGIIAAIIVTWGWAADTHPDAQTFWNTLGHNIGTVVFGALWWTVIIIVVGVGLMLLCALITSPFYLIHIILKERERRALKVALTVPVAVVPTPVLPVVVQPPAPPPL